MAEEKSLQPSKKKLEKMRKEGKVLKSPLVTQTASFLGCLAGLYGYGLFAMERNKTLLEYCWLHGYARPAVCGDGVVREVLVASLATLASALLAAIIAEVWQVGFRVQPALSAPRMNRLDATQGMRKVVGGVKGVAGMLLRATLLLLTFGWLLLEAWPGIVRSFFVVRSEVPSLITLPWHFVLWGGAVLLVCAVAEYAGRYRAFYKEASMSHQEMRQEYKDDEGDPHVRAQRRQMHESLLMQEMVKRVRRSNVIVVEKAAKAT